MAGWVWCTKPRTSSLRRFVAIKFQPDDVSKDHQALSRFQREAKAASSLNHPNICTIYEMDEADGGIFVAMELQEGQTLRHMIAGRPLAMETVLELAILMLSSFGVIFASPKSRIFDSLRFVTKMLAGLMSR